MAKYTNNAAGARGINVKISKDKDAPSTTTWIEPGETAEIDDALIADTSLPDGVEKGEAAAKKAADAQADTAAN